MIALDAGDWDGIERRADSGNRCRVSVVFGRETSTKRMREIALQEGPCVPSQIAPNEAPAGDPETLHSPAP